MAFQQMYVSTTNPNNTVGGGGCACDPTHQGDCKGPFVVMPGNDMENPLSPHVVMGAACIDKAHELIHGGNALALTAATDKPNEILVTPDEVVDYQVRADGYARVLDEGVEIEELSPIEKRRQRRQRNQEETND